MSVKLDRLIDDFARAHFADKGLKENVYAAQKKLEEDIIEEICEEKSQEIAARANQIEQQEQVKAQFRELKAVYIQCIFLALLIGLLGSHLYDLMKYWLYDTTPDVDITRFGFGLVITLIICIIVCVWMFVSQIIKVYEIFISKKD
ncbi:hypothetical protein BTIS_0146 [Bifidobacterium tissieri]|uniref:Uncharacterized protein n=1 Tax=Bifidobacterium tissieri TaxID=1630162 RepID=A0A261FK70_9BIFI|nr:hypothetical protein [Bifidobacterium tissieri]OZG59415.1 hypothetical protein BTIS_0146 [Bifidobacterium tissieri]